MRLRTGNGCLEKKSKVKVYLSSPGLEGDEKELTESPFISLFIDFRRWQRNGFHQRFWGRTKFSASAPSTRDKCLTEGYSRSCRVLMIWSPHTAIPLVLHEALWHNPSSAPSVSTAQYLCRLLLWCCKNSSSYSVLIRICSVQPTTLYVYLLALNKSHLSLKQ